MANVLSWILFGLIVGVISNEIDPHPEDGGILGASILGVLGSLAGGVVSNYLFGSSFSGFNIPAFFIAVGGSLLILFLGKSVSSLR